MLASPEAIEAPVSWFDDPLPALSQGADCAAALKTCGSELRKIITRPSAHATKAFQAQLVSALGGDPGHAMVTFPKQVPAAVACTLLAAWLGVPAGSVHDEIGGTASNVVSGAGHRHDQAWHTDSTAWLLPNRFTLLGLRSETGQDAPTGILPIRRLEHLLLDDQEALAALRSEDLPWRVNFPHLPQLWGPILDPVAPRWVRPVVDPLREQMSPVLACGVGHLEAALAGQAPWYEPTTARGRLVVFDNYEVMHRGPAFESSYGRELIRIKVGGKAVL